MESKALQADCLIVRRQTMAPARALSSINRQADMLGCIHRVCRSKSDFFEDPGIDPRFRARLSDYRNSGYDWGHMVRDPSTLSES